MEATMDAVNLGLSVVDTPVQFSTETVEEPKRKPDLQRYKITGVLASVGKPSDANPNGANSIDVGLVGLEIPGESRLRIWVMEQFVENVRVSPKSLPLGEQVTENGKTFTKGNKQNHYARAIANSKGTATIQVLTTEAAKQGQAFVLPDTYEALIANLNETLAGVEILATRRENDNGFMEIKDLYSVDKLGDQKFLNRMSKQYRVPFLEQ